MVFVGLKAYCRVHATRTVGFHLLDDSAPLLVRDILGDFPILELAYNLRLAGIKPDLSQPAR